MTPLSQQGLSGLHERFRQTRLLEDPIAADRFGARLMRAAAMPAEADRRNVARGWAFAQPPNELESIDAGQCQICNQERRHTLRDDIEGFFPVGRLKDLEGLAEEIRVDLPRVNMVFDQQDHERGRNWS